MSFSSSNMNELISQFKHLPTPNKVQLFAKMFSSKPNYQISDTAVNTELIPGILHFNL